jgi:uncharacterized DUF497 family protein
MAYEMVNEFNKIVLYNPQHAKEAKAIFQGPVLSLEDESQDGEIRERSYGLIRGVAVVCVVHTLMGDAIRIISARKATLRERTLFDAHYR